MKFLAQYLIVQMFYSIKIINILKNYYDKIKKRLEIKGVKYKFKKNLCQSCINIYGNYYYLHTFNYFCDQCYSKVTAEFMISILIIAYFFYSSIFFYMKIYEKLNLEKIIDLDGMVKLQEQEIKKLNVQIILLKEEKDQLLKKRSCCSIDTENRSFFPMAENESYILRNIRKESDSPCSRESFNFEKDSSSNGGDVMNLEWKAKDCKLVTDKLRESLLTFIFTKQVKYIDGVKFHRISIFCSKGYNRKIREITIVFKESPGFFTIIL